MQAAISAIARFVVVGLYVDVASIAKGSIAGKGVVLMKRKCDGW